MRLTRIQTLTAVALSLAVHVAGAAIFIPPEATIEIAGGTATSQLVIGTAFDDSLMAGEPGEVLEPVETPPNDAEAVDPSETVAVEPVETNEAEYTPEAATQPVPSQHLPASTERPLEPGPVPPDLASVAEPAPALSPAPSEPVQSQAPDTLISAPAIEAMPAQSEELASLAPAREIEPVAEPKPEIALPENIPLPVPRPEPPQTARAESKPPAPAPQTAKATQTKPRTSKRDREAQRAASRPSKAGDGGQQRATTSKASSGSVAAKRATAAGNAAVSNYPGKIASKLRRALRYPREAKRQGIRGDVVVTFVVAGNGGVSSVRISRSSGAPVLDRAAADAVRRAAPFPPIPAGAGRASWSFSVPLGFTR
ncbi:TonB family protein [Hoeflea sp.]|uniref:TonB family protein n=1 Tax=Hoeflea sp. TaxID=1940281 RepID=UPI0019AC1B65|nr:TonB family protein [Hoeflea sp.]MBC7283969.1 TonB family protein [Hoeflea sp.]